MRLLLVAAAAALLAGCAAPPRVVHLKVSFDEAHARALLAPGKNTIRGNAMMRQMGGGVVTCAGMDVHLVPATEYAKHRMAAIYGSTSFSREGVKFEPDSPAYRDAERVTKCNAQGFFTFDELADGEFFMITVVAWKAGHSVEGGMLMGRAAVAGGQTKEITMAR